MLNCPSICHVLWRGRYVTSCCVIKMLCDDHVMWQIMLCDGSRYVTCHVMWRSCCVTLTSCDIMFGAIMLWNCHIMWQSRCVTSRYVAAPILHRLEGLPPWFYGDSGNGSDPYMIFHGQETAEFPPFFYEDRIAQLSPWFCTDEMSPFPTCFYTD